MGKSIARRMTELFPFPFFPAGASPYAESETPDLQRAMHRGRGGEGYVYIHVFHGAAKRDRIDEFLRSRGNGSDLRFNGPALRTRINRPFYGRLFFTAASVKMLSFFYDEGEKVPRCPPVVRPLQSISLALRRSGRTAARNNVQQCSSK